jgi:type II secretory pathway component PulK
MARPLAATHPRKNEEGIALILVLLLILLISAIVVDYSYEAQVESSLTANNRDEFQAYVAAKSAIASGLALLQEDVVQGSMMQQGQRTINQLQGGQEQQTSDIDSFVDVWAQPVAPQPLNDATAMCTIDDECGKINLNALLLYDPNNDPESDQREHQVLVMALRLLFKQMNLEGDTDPVDAILDWLDTNSQGRERGAESDAYEGGGAGYGCKNGPMDSIEELLLIQGITPEIYFDCNRQQDQQQDIMKGEEKERPPSLSDLLTVHGDPQGKINVNTARREVLEAIFEAMRELGTGGAGDPVGAAENVVRQRLTNPFQNVGDFANVAGITLSNPGATTTTTTTTTSTTGKKTVTPITPGPVAGGASNDVFDVRSNFFRIHGDGRANDVMVRVEAFVFRNYNPMNPQYAQQTTTQSSSKTTATSGTTSTGTTGTPGTTGSQGYPGGQPLEAFRILDWRVIR